MPEVGIPAEGQQPFIFGRFEGPLVFGFSVFGFSVGHLLGWRVAYPDDSVLKFPMKRWNRTQHAEFIGILIS